MGSKNKWRSKLVRQKKEADGLQKSHPHLAFAIRIGCTLFIHQPFTEHSLLRFFSAVILIAAPNVADKPLAQVHILNDDRMGTADAFSLLTCSLL